MQHAGGGSFHVANQVGDLDVAAEAAQKMDVVFDSSDDDRRAVQIVESSRQIGMHVRLQPFGLQERRAVLRGEYDVQIDLREGLGHGEVPGESSAESTSCY